MLIYKLTNTITQKSYVGKTTKTLEERFYRHKYASRYKSTHLYRSMRKHGVECFTAEVLEYVVEDNLDDRERFWIASIQPEYNMTDGGEGGNTSGSQNYKDGMERYHTKPNPDKYKPTYGMLGKKQSEKFFNAIKESNSCPVMCDGVLYQSVGEAQEALPGISVRKRLDSPKHPNFYRLKPKKTMK